jgi:uncharacterized membrane protein
MGDALLSGKSKVFRAVALIEFPRPGVWALVFITDVPGREFTEATGESVRCVFLPTTPNPTTGYLLLVPERDIRRLNITVEEGIKMVISGGAYIPGREGAEWGRRAAVVDSPEALRAAVEELETADRPSHPG